jgi:hypothetical protein
MTRGISESDGDNSDFAPVIRRHSSGERYFASTKH